MKAPKKSLELREKPQTQAMFKLPFDRITNPFKVETRYAKAGVDYMRKGVGIFFKVKF